MTPEKPPPGTIPTLTEVVPWPESPPPIATSPVAVPLAAEPGALLRPPAPPPAAAPASAPAGAASAAPQLSAGQARAPSGPAPAVAESQLAERVMTDLQGQIDLMLEVRLREALAPILARASDAIVRDARRALTTALRDVVARSVARELSRTDKP